MTWHRTLSFLAQQAVVKCLATTERVHHSTLATILPRSVSGCPCKLLATSQGGDRPFPRAFAVTGLQHWPCFQNILTSRRFFQNAGYIMGGKAALVRLVDVQIKPSASLSPADDGNLTQPVTVHGESRLQVSWDTERCASIRKASWKSSAFSIPSSCEISCTASRSCNHETQDSARQVSPHMCHHQQAYLCSWVPLEMSSAEPIDGM